MECRKKYKDKCDNCKKFDYCSGYNNKVLCNECIQKEKELIKEKGR